MMCIDMGAGMHGRCTPSATPGIPCVHLHTCQHTPILKQKAGGVKDNLLQQVGKQVAGIEGCGSCSM